LRENGCKSRNLPSAKNRGRPPKPRSYPCKRNVAGVARLFAPSESEDRVNRTAKVLRVNIMMTKFRKGMMPRGSCSRTITASDSISIKLYNATVLRIGIGQRYGVRRVANTWDVGYKLTNNRSSSQGIKLLLAITLGYMRFHSSLALESLSSILTLRSKLTTPREIDNSDDIRGIVYYEFSPWTPTTSAYEYEDSCNDKTASLVPHISKEISTSTSTKSETDRALQQ
jgi:hypothetical protein